MIYERQTIGFCMPWGPSKITVAADGPIYSGDLVHVLVRRHDNGEVYGTVKQLEATRDGRWWLVCLEGTVPIGGYFLPAAIHKIVLRLDDPLLENRPGGAGGNRATIQFWDQESLDARDEWTRLGKLRDVKFPGLEKALELGGTDWPESFRLPANYFGCAA